MTTSPVDTQAAPGSTRPGRPGIALTVIAACQLMVVLDATIVNIALPHIQDALSFSTTDLSWVLSAYTLTFGGLLLLGGRAGDILGRRRVFLTGILLFTFASLLGGFAQEPWHLLAARALQGVGGAIASPTSLALITTTFPEGPERNRAFGVFAAVSAGGGAIGLLAGGMLTEWLDWRWVLFVNVPIGLLIAFLTPRYINESERHPGRFDIAGALTSTLGMASLVYGFIRASEEGWRDPLTIGSFIAAVILLAAFAIVESRAREPITPLRMFADRNRSGTYVIMLSLAAAMFGMFFFIVLFVQNVLGYSPIQSGLAFLPVTVAIVTGAGLSQRLLPVLGPKPFMVTGSAITGVGLFWQTFITPESSYVGGVLGPMVMFGFGMGLNFVTLTLTAVSGVAQHEAGAASGLLNATQQVGGSLGLSILVTVFGTASRSEGEKQAASFLATATPEQKTEFATTKELPAPWGHEVLTAGISTAFTAAVGMVLLALITAVAVIRVRKSDLEALSGKAEAGGPVA
ncbi:MFS transporter [Streptomyces vilmorinianum]|uniref:MFS transporter n=1 Tax=Streptomyces vilmorinianum TaxID=3051092 RepID=UPI0010FAEDD9|nr:MFS transporter [Streptomyces vilmorinianum]